MMTVEDLIEDYESEIEELEEIIEADETFESLVGFDPQISVRLYLNRQRLYNLLDWLRLTKRS
jgi:hypothetical protein